MPTRDGSARSLKVDDGPANRLILQHAFPELGIYYPPTHIQYRVYHEGTFRFIHARFFACTPRVFLLLFFFNPSLNRPNCHPIFVFSPPVFVCSFDFLFVLSVRPLNCSFIRPSFLVPFVCSSVFFFFFLCWLVCFFMRLSLLGPVFMSACLLSLLLLLLFFVLSLIPLVFVWVCLYAWYVFCLLSLFMSVLTCRVLSVCCVVFWLLHQNK